MKHSDIYKMINNPLEDERIMDEIINVYGEGSPYYNNLIRVFSKDKDMRYSITESDRLHAGLFNNWKKQLLSITKEQYEEAIKVGLYDKSIYKLLDFLRKTPNVKTKKEADDILFDEYEDKELQEAMDKYSWSGDQNSWTHIRKRKITGKKVGNFPIEHRLYLNVDSKQLHEVSRHFINKCEKKGLNFYFKIAEYSKRDDTMVIYSDTENLPNFIEVLEEIRKEHPEIVPAFQEPTLLSGRINDWLGYGSEPLSEHNSFNNIRSEIIEKSINEIMKNWYKANQQSTFKYKGKILTFSEYIATRLVEEDIKKSKEIYDRNPNAKYAAFTKEELNNKKYLTEHLKKVTGEIEPLLTSVITGSKTDKKIIYKSGDKERRITSYDISSILRKISPEIIKAQPKLKVAIKESIKKESAKKGIDINKFCFDIKNKELLENVASKQSEQQKKKPEEKPEQEQTTTPKKEETTSKTYVYKPMTDEEIEESRKKIGEYIPPKKKEDKSSQRYVYRPMTDEEIEESRKKIGEYIPPKKKEDKSSQRYVYRPMTEKEIEESRSKLGEYVPPKTRPIEEILKNVTKPQITKDQEPTPKKSTTKSSSNGNVTVNQNNTIINQKGTINQNGGINITNVGTININVPPRYGFQQGNPKVINPQKNKSKQNVKTK